MILDDVFERFAREAPVTVMARAALENALNPRALDQLFEDVAAAPVHPDPPLLLDRRPDERGRLPHPARDPRRLPEHAPVVGVTREAVYDKLDRTEPGIAAALVRHTAAALGPVITAMGGERPAWLPGYRVRILDGNHLAGTEHRLKELRTIGAGALPGQALVVLDPQLMLVTDVVLCEDGHAQERSLLEPGPGDGPAPGPLDRRPQLLHDRLPLRDRPAGGVLRDPPARRDLHWEFVGKRRACGRIETGKVFEQTIRVADDEGEVLILRRITVVLDQPTRDGDTEIHLLTNVPGQGRPGQGDRRVVPPAVDDRDRLRRIGGDAQRRDQHAGLSQGGACSPSAWRWCRTTS